MVYLNTLKLYMVYFYFCEYTLLEKVSGAYGPFPKVPSDGWLGACWEALASR